MPTNVTISLWYNYQGPGNRPVAIPERPDLGTDPHPQAVMRHYGITYKEAWPSPITDSWRFIDCQNVPENRQSWMSISKTPDAIEGGE